MQGIEHLKEAHEILVAEGSELRESVSKAAQAFWDAHAYLPSWPDELQTAANDVYRHILAHGTIDQTIHQLDDAALDAARKALLEFCMRAERHAN